MAVRRMSGCGARIYEKDEPIVLRAHTECGGERVRRGRGGRAKTGARLFIYA